ncbi:hypothetical protein OIU76_009611 [Salix suchowensis]|nr:Dead-box atp-dependent rna helicase [Salix suchowensis]KAJ6331048.1 hypothetical protein OIU76_009611 [Salix suchowensis]KAJ6362412.1 hypothetical protein OIU78_002753 [Salix suchowensis]
MAETHRSMPAVDIDDSTPSKEEMEALVQTEICSGNNHDERHQSSKSEKTAENDVKPKAPNLIERVKEEFEATIHHGKPPVHHKETHGRNDNIDASTPIDQVKGPSIFQRAKEEIEALVQTIGRKKESSNFVSSPKKDGGLGACIGRGLEKVCFPNWGSKRD